MAEKYVDASTGSDSNGGTSGAPYLTIQKGIDNVAAGDTLWLSNVADFVVSTAITWNTGFSGTTSYTSRLKIRAWDNGGSTTIDRSDGSTIVAARIDGNDTAASICTTASPSYVSWYGIIFTSTTAGLFQLDQRSSMNSCEFTDWGSGYAVTMGSYAKLFDCYFHDDGGSGLTAVYMSGTGNIVQGCYFKNISGDAIYALATRCHIQNNLTFRVLGLAVKAAGFNPSIVDNTFIGSTGADCAGIGVTNTGMGTVMNNVLTHFNGSSGYAVKCSGGGTIAFYGHNRLWDNTSNYISVDIPGIDRTASDVTTDADPYTDYAAGDYSIDNQDNAVGAAYPTSFPGTNTLNSQTIGAVGTPPVVAPTGKEKSYTFHTS